MYVCVRERERDRERESKANVPGDGRLPLSWQSLVGLIDVVWREDPGTSA